MSNAAENARRLTDDELAQHLREIAEMLKRKGLPDSAAQCEEAAKRISA